MSREDEKKPSNDFLLQEAFKALMRNKDVKLDLNDIARVIATSRDGYRSVMQSDAKHRVEAIKEAQAIQPGIFGDHLLTAEGLLYQKIDGGWKTVELPDGDQPIAMFPKYYHAMLLTKNHNLYGIGSNHHNLFGDNSLVNLTHWTRLEIAPEVGVKKIWVLLSSSFVQGTDNQVYVCGYNFHGLGVGYSGYKHSEIPWVPIQLSDDVKIQVLISGSTFNCIMDAQSELYLTGQFPGLESNDTWRKFELPDGMRPVKIVAGYGYLIFISQEGELYGCGGNAYGEFGLGDTDRRENWEKLDLPGSPRIRDISSDTFSVLVITENNKLFVAGKSENGNLGTWPDVYRDQWYEVTLPDDIGEIQKVEKDFLLTTAGDLYQYRDEKDNERVVKIGEKVIRFFESKGDTYFVSQSNELYCINRRTKAPELIDLPEGVSLLPVQSDFSKSIDAVNVYLDSQDDAGALDTLVDTLSEAQLITALLKMPPEKAEEANHEAFDAIRRNRNVGSGLFDASAAAADSFTGSYDSKVNYLVQYKENRLMKNRAGKEEDLDCAAEFKR